MAVRMHRASARERDNRREFLCGAVALGRDKQRGSDGCRCGHVDQVSRSAANVNLAIAVQAHLLSAQLRSLSSRALCTYTQCILRLPVLS